MKTQIVFIVLILNISGCGKMSKETAYNKVVITGIQFKDTLIRYSLTSDSLVLEFEKPLQHKNWVGEIYLIKDGESSNIHFGQNIQTDGELGTINFKNGRTVFKNFHIPKDSLHYYKINFHAVPTFPGCRCIGQVYAPLFLFDEKRGHPGLLTTAESVKDFSITKIDFVVLKKLPTELQEFCRDSIKSKYGIRYTDIEIEESHY